MKPSDDSLPELIALARRAKPQTSEPAEADDVRLFAQRTVAERNRRRAASATATPDPLRLWEQASNWSLATAAAIVLIALLRPEPPPSNPFDAFGPVNAEEINLF